MRTYRKKNILNRNVIASGMYAFANIISKGIVFLTVPVFTRMLTTSEMGVVTVFNSICSLLFPIMTLSVTAGTLQIGLAEYKECRDEYSAETLIISTITTLITGILLVVFRKTICSFCHIGFGMLLLIVLYSLFYAALDIWYTRARYEHRYISYTFVSVSIAFISTIISVVCVIFFSEKAGYNLGIIKVISQNVVIIAGAMVAYVHIIFRGKAFFDKKQCRRIIAISWPLVFHSLSKNVLDISDRLMIAYICGDSDAGIYGTLAGFSVIVVIIWNSIDVSIVPSIFAALEIDDYDTTKEICENALYVFMYVTIVSVVLMPLFARLMTVKEYFDGLFIIPILLLSNFFLAIYHIFGALLLYRKKTILIMVGTIISAVINIVLNILMLKNYGYAFAAVTTVIAFASQAMLQGILCYREYGRTIINVRKVLFMTVVCVVLCTIGAYLKYNDALRFLILIAPFIMTVKVKDIIIKR